MKRKICVITGTRADYGILNTLMRKIKVSKDLSLYIVATGMHLMREFGYTVKEIERDGFDVYEKVDISYNEDSGRAMAGSVGEAVIAFSKLFSRLRPAMVVVLGDRGEMLAAAIAANYLNVPVAHLHGGEISGHIDGILRHAITKLSHLHFPATQKAKARILKLGEDAWRVFVAGAPALDRILNEKLPAETELVRKYKLDPSRPFLLVVQHPVLLEIGAAADQIRITLEAVRATGLPALVIYPNADAGGRRMIEVIRQYENSGNIRSIISLPHKDYLGLMKPASALIGNSSSGFIEAPSFKLPVINIGNRQLGRERGINVIDVQHEKQAIVKAIKKVLFNNKFRTCLKECKNPYGDGKASQRIVRILSMIKTDRNLLQKQITY